MEVDLLNQLGENVGLTYIWYNTANLNKLCLHDLIIVNVEIRVQKVEFKLCFLIALKITL